MIDIENYPNSKKLINEILSSGHNVELYVKDGVLKIIDVRSRRLLSAAIMPKKPE
jgi:hypothetical protein